MFLRFSGILQLFFFNLQVALALKMDFSFFLEVFSNERKKAARGSVVGLRAWS